MKSQYDMVLSLGGSCAVASQLKERGLRLASYPFDWLFTRDPKSLDMLVQCFRENFEHWMLPENLIDVVPDDYNPHAAKYQYQDVYTGYRFIHDFIQPKESSAADVRRKYMRRIKRMSERLKVAKHIALCFDAEYGGCREPLLAIRRMILDKFGGNKLIDCYLVEFKADRFEILREGPLSIYRFPHPKNDYIFSRQTFEFSYMDDFVLSDMFKSEERGKGNRLYLAHTAHGIKCVLFKNQTRKLGLALTIGNRKYELAWGGGVS